MTGQRHADGHAAECTTVSEYLAAIELAQAGLCGHGGHGWDGETCDEVPDVMVACPTCDGTGQSVYRGAPMRGYDEPDYEDACGICGGSGELPASMFVSDDGE
jgi:hypothetical protein